jgi:hypothetical protein
MKDERMFPSRLGRWWTQLDAAIDEGDNVGQREGWGETTTTIAGGEVALSLSSRGVGKDLGERVVGGRPMMARVEGTLSSLSLLST